MGGFGSGLASVEDTTFALKQNPVSLSRLNPPRVFQQQQTPGKGSSFMMIRSRTDSSQAQMYSVSEQVSPTVYQRGLSRVDSVTVNPKNLAHVQERLRLLQSSAGLFN